MPQQSTATKRTASKTRPKKSNQSLWGRMLSSRYAMPAVFVVTFMAIGFCSLYLVFAATTTYNLWGNTVPRILAVSDNNGTELGLRFRSNVAGYVTGVRFYKGAQNTGSHTGSLWDSTGKLLASVTFVNETKSGWQTAIFTEPISVASDTTYIVSYHAPNGHYSLNKNYLSTTRTRNNLVAPRTTTAAPNGIYVTTATPRTFPSQSGNGANYWVDVVFNTKLVSPQPAPAAPTEVIATVQTNKSVMLTWQASVGANPIAKYTVFRGGDKLADVGTALTYTDSTTQADTTYDYQVQATDSTGLTSQLSLVASVAIPSDVVGDNTPPPTPGTDPSCQSPTPSHVPDGPDGTGTCWPGPKTTGVPSGTVLSDYAGCVISTSDVVITAKTFNCTSDALIIRATNVTIKNSKINGMVFLDADINVDWSVTIEDSEINAGNILQSALSDANITVRRTNIQGGINSMECDPPMHQCTIEDSYFHGQTNVQGIDTHVGGFLSDGGTNIRVVHNTIVCDVPVNNVGGGCTGDLNFIPNFAAINGADVLHNLFGANNGASYCTYGGEKPGSAYPHSYNMVYIDNVFQGGGNSKCAAYGPVTGFSTTNAGNKWQNNTWANGGEVQPAM